MENRSSDRRVVDAERLGGGVIITFDDGKCAVYSAPLLYSILSNANLLEEQIEEPD
jgi:hypothetical protein